MAGYGDGGYGEGGYGGDPGAVGASFNAGTGTTAYESMLKATAGGTAAAGPDPYKNYDAIKDLIRRKREDWNKGRRPFILAAYRNILFYRGKHWWKFDVTMNTFRPVRLPRNVPTPVTNIFAATMDSITSVFARVEPTLNFRPSNPDEASDRATADVAKKAIEVIEDEVSIRVNRQMLAIWVSLTGMAWLETGYDPDPVHGMTTIQADQCPQCGQTQPPGQSACQSCGSPRLQPAMDAQGQPIGEQVPKGKMYLDIVPIFEMFFDPAISDWKQHRAYLREKSQTVDQSKSRWPHIKDKIMPNVMAGDEIYSGSIPTLGPQIDETVTSRSMMTGGRPTNTRVTEQWFWQLPDDTYPQGLLAVVVGKTEVAYAGPLPYSSPQPDGSRKPFLPHVFFPQKLVPGTMFAKTVADDIALKQTQRNQWESIIQACGMRTGSPVWLKPKGSNVTNMTGDPGNIIEYNAIGPNAAKPERIQGQGIPLAFIKMIEMIDKSVEDLAGLYDVLKGSRPPGVSAGIALQILQERGMSRFGPLFILWEASWAEWARQALEIFREFVTEPRLLRIQGKDGQWEVEKFLGSDLQGQVDVIPEANSSTPRSTLLDRAEMEQLVASGALPPPATNPELQAKFLEIYGRSNLLPSMKADTKNAIREDEAFEALAQNPMILQATPQDVQGAQAIGDYPTLVSIFKQMYGIDLPKVRPSVDDHAIHAREHKLWLKSESSQKLPEIIQFLAEKHNEYHNQLMIQQLQAVRGLQQPGGTPGGYLQPPPMQQTMNTSSSPDRMAGDGQEMNQDMVATGG